ncbi:CYTH and CHAD domain-containing protein [Methylobacterium segetis]|uniref:CYTH and CHAD domain-containing protein n=2 Tax=Methylobacterium segetis TaxID=2488750 RepID=UPI00104EFF60|nr:CYTH and CHAD domain-containing protein [Methylobacterium segetis]
MSRPRETELKLECDRLDLTALGAHPLLQGDGAPATLVSTYFDTPDEDLRAAGLTLRVRSRGEERIQTVKAEGGAAAAGLFDRPEWESPIAGDAPDPAVYADTPVAAILADAKDARLEPCFTTVVMRRERTLSYGASRISVTLDEGRVETQAGDAPLCELELELEEGTTADLFALAQALAETVPLRLGALSKSERGFALRDGRLSRPSKAGAVVLREDASAGDAFRSIVMACLRHLRLNEAVFLASRDPEALHQIRVSLRRLRSAFSLFKPILAHDPRAAGLGAEIKQATEPFGRARNLDVFLETTLPEEMARRPDEPGLEELAARLGAERDRAHGTVSEILASPEWRRLLLDLLSWLQTGPWLGEGADPARDEPARDFAATVLERFRKRVCKRGRHLAKLDPEARHQVRIAGKKLRYGADFFASLFPDKKARKRHKTFSAALSDLQDHLGALNDLATAHSVMASLADGPPGVAASGPALFAAGLTAADNEARTKQLLAAAEEAHDDLSDAKPFWR